jgi:hypothetical protein
VDIKTRRTYLQRTAKYFPSILTVGGDFDSPCGKEKSKQNTEAIETIGNRLKDCFDFFYLLSKFLQWSQPNLGHAVNENVWHLKRTSWKNIFPVELPGQLAQMRTAPK